MRNDKFIVNGWFVVSCVLAISLVLCVLIYIEDAEAQLPLDTDYPYIRLQSDTGGFGFEYTNEYHYTNVERMAWSDEYGLTEIDEYGYLVEQWIDRDTGAITNIYIDAATGDWYSLCFNGNPLREGRIYAAHITCGAYWVEPR